MTSLRALAAQVAAWCVTWWLIRAGWAALTPQMAAWACGGLALVFAAALRLPRWWLPIELLFAPLLLLALRSPLSPWVYFLVLALLALLYWSTFRTRVPLYLSGRRSREALLRSLPAPKPGTVQRFIDLGCGFGGVVLEVARHRTDLACEGVELAPLPAWIGMLRARWQRGTRCAIRRASLWDLDLAPFDCVYAFLSPVPMQRLWHKVRNEMRPGTLFISNTFEVPQVTPSEVLEVGDLRGTRLYIFRL